MPDQPIYLDNNATTPMDPRVFEAMRPWFLEHFGNAASTTHLYGWQARDAVEDAREQTAALIGASPKEIVFTSGATESVNLAIKGMASARKGPEGHIITCVTEHKAVLDTCHFLETTGQSITYLPVNAQGHLDMDLLQASIRHDTYLIALMYANNETGLIHPVHAIAAIARQHGLAFFCDATQAAGKLDINVEAAGIDLLAFSAHKIYGPKGTGALFVRKDLKPVKPGLQMHGGGHERGLRSGTLNVPGIVGMGISCLLAQKELEPEASRLNALRNVLESKLLLLPGAFRNGSPVERLPNTTNIGFQGLEGQQMMLALSRYMAISSGAACTSVTQEPSFVLKAMGRSDTEARASFRFSLGRFTTNDDIIQTADRFLEVWERFAEKQSTK